MTAANNALLSYPCKPRPALNAVKNALRGTMFSARVTKFSFSAGEVFSPELWLLNDTQSEQNGTVKVLLEFDGNEIVLGEWTASAPINTNVKGDTFSYVLPNADVNTFKLKL